MGQACRCDCDDGQHELYQEMVMSAKSPAQKRYNENGDPQIMDADDRDLYNQDSLKPLKRNKMKRDDSEGELFAGGQ